MNGMIDSPPISSDVEKDSTVDHSKEDVSELSIDREAETKCASFREFYECTTNSCVSDLFGA